MLLSFSFSFSCMPLPCTHAYIHLHFGGIYYYLFFTFAFPLVVVMTLPLFILHFAVGQDSFGLVSPVYLLKRTKNKNSTGWGQGAGSTRQDFGRWRDRQGQDLLLPSLIPFSSSLSHLSSFLHYLPLSLPYKLESPPFRTSSLLSFYIT